MVYRRATESGIDQRYVTIFGAGVAGLTAAHELVERGFRVQVWEPARDQRDPRRGLDVGGLARTQWSRVSWDVEPPADGRLIRGLPIHHFLQKLYVLPPDWTPGSCHARHETAGWVKVDPPVLAPDATVEALIVGLAALEPAEQLKRVQGIFDAFVSERSAALQSGPRVDPYYDAARQLFHGRLGGIQFVAPLREPKVDSSEITAVLNVWSKGNLGPASWTYVSPWEIGEGHVYGLARTGVASPKRIVGELMRELAMHPHIDHVFVEITRRETGNITMAEALRRATSVTDLLKGSDSQLDQADDPLTPGSLKIGDPYWATDTIRLDVSFGGRKVTFELLLLDGITDGLPPRADAVIGFRARERWLPGEHGFRFFPAFYHHLFDTMKRTPILETEQSPRLFMAQERAVGIEPSSYRYVETGRSAFDALKPSNAHALAFAGHRPSVLTRSKPRSFEELRDYLRVFYGSKETGGFDADPRDVSFFMLKLLQYMTSCDERRKEYEGMSWWDYIEGNRYAPGFADLLLKWPKALVAMDAKSADARTNGTTTVQITLDLFRDGGYRDGILKGPTNEAWLEPWRRYLEAQGVEFVQGRLEKLELAIDSSAEPVVLPRVQCFEPRYPVGEDGQPNLLPGYFVLALPAYEVARVARDFRDGLSFDERQLYCPEDSDLGRAARIDISALRDGSGNPLPIRGDGAGEFRNYAGIQFYFTEDVFWLEGQVYHPDSEYGLTTVSQARFWEDKMDWEHGYRGVLSVIIANWATPSKSRKPGEEGKCAFELTPQELAEEVWRQIEESVKGRSKHAPGVSRSRTPTFDKPPAPLYWHLDDNIYWKEEPESAQDGRPRGYYNRSPFHIVPPGKWRDLPGELDHERGYEVRHGVVLAGTYAKTYTRIPCMETANESARHAVNAILREVGAKGGCTFCDIWNPEDREADDLGWLKELDAKLMARGRGHVFELYGLEKLIRFGMRGGPDDPFDPIEAWRTVSRILRRFSRAMWSKGP